MSSTFTSISAPTSSIHLACIGPLNWFWYHQQTICTTSGHTNIILLLYNYMGIHGTQRETTLDITERYDCNFRLRPCDEAKRDAR